MDKKNYAIGKYIAIWWNEPQGDQQFGYRSITVRRRHKDKNGVELEEKCWFPVDEFLRLAAEVEAAANFLVKPRELEIRAAQEE